MNFNKEAFLSAGQKAVANSTFVIQCPTGDWPGVVAKIDAEQAPTTKDPSKLYTRFIAFIEINEPQVVEKTKRSPTTVRHDFFLDTTEDGSGLDMSDGKNIGLGRLREALDLNRPGQSWSFEQFVGRPLIAHVEHESYNGEQYAKVTRVAKRQ